VFHTGVLDPLAELEATPIEVDGRLFVTDGHDDVFALNATTGQMLWKFDGFNDEAQLAAFFLLWAEQPWRGLRRRYRVRWEV